MFRAWSYFFQQLQSDPSLNIDREARFSVPENLDNEAVYDYEELTQGELPPPAEGTDAGSGSSNDYIDIPVSDGKEEITTESRKLDQDDQKVLEEMKKAQEKDAEKAAAGKATKDSVTTRKRGFLKKLLGGKEQP